MSKCNGSSQQQWMWKRSALTASDSAVSFVKKQKSHSRLTTSASSIKQPPKIAQELAVGDY